MEPTVLLHRGDLDLGDEVLQGAETLTLQAVLDRLGPGVADEGLEVLADQPGAVAEQLLPRGGRVGLHVVGGEQEAEGQGLTLVKHPAEAGDVVLFGLDLTGSFTRDSVAGVGAVEHQVLHRAEIDPLLVDVGPRDGGTEQTRSIDGFDKIHSYSYRWSVWIGFFGALTAAP